MDALCAAIPVARGLLRLADSTAPRALRVIAGNRRATLRTQHGALVEVSGVDAEPLGDTLLRLGALDADRHYAALESAFPIQCVGAWLVAVGAASESAVRAALQLQLSGRVAALLRWRGAELVSHESPCAPGLGLRVTVELVPCVYAALIGIARELPAHALAQRSGREALRPTRLGQRLALRLGASLDPLLARDPAPESLAARAALRAIGGLVDASAEVDGYSLLLRKRRELRTQVSARGLLDLPDGARPEQARSAFRRLAHKLHPDRFYAGEPGLLALSNEVMRALASAEAELSAQQPRRQRAVR